jgi:predicted HTH domain antitoxin
MEQIKHKGGVMPRKLILEFPEEISEKDLEDEEVQRRSKEGAVFELLRKKKISQGKAAELLGITKRTLRFNG